MKTVTVTKRMIISALAGTIMIRGECDYGAGERE